MRRLLQNAFSSTEQPQDNTSRSGKCWRSSQNVDLTLLAREMQILGPDFVAQSLLRMINIQHCFRTAFVEELGRAGGRCPPKMRLTIARSVSYFASSPPLH